MMNIPALIKRLICCIVIIPAYCNGQMFDDFADGNFSSNPAWEGNENKFKINNSFQLQLDDTGEGTAFLFTTAEISTAMEWHCYVREAFSPSSNNNCRIYLSAQKDSNADPPDGIFLQLGEAGALDAIRLMEQKNGDTATLICGSQGAIASSFSCFVKIIFENNSWKLFADYEESGNFLLEGVANGELQSETANIGVMCKYTLSNSTKFYFDDFYAGPIQYDTIPPEVELINVTGFNQIEIKFSEYLDPETALDPENYMLSHEMGNPQYLSFKDGGQDVVLASFSDSLIYGQLIQLNVKNIADISGNMIIPVSNSFSWYQPERYDVIINEIMADPSPALGLPEYEYLELYNTSSLPLNLSSWTLTLGSSEKLLVDLIIKPQEYVIIGKEEAENEFASYGDYYGLESISLTNSGQDIMLNDNNGELIHGLSYDKSWYHDEERSEGGWSMEMINPYNPCLTNENWFASSHVKGGSPGRKNTVYDEVFPPPNIIKCCVLDSLRINIMFNQSMNIDPESKIFKLDHGLGAMKEVLPDDQYHTSFILFPSSPLLNNIIYTLDCQGELMNCIGNSFYISESISIGLPENPAYNDIIINEVLFNPFPGGEDYVEIYNRSEKPILASSLILASVRENPPSPPDTSFIQLNSYCNVIMPGEYVLLSKVFNKIDNYYDCSSTEQYIEMGSFPSYSNEKGTVLLLDGAHTVIDAFSYHEDMQYPLLNHIEGVSLERIHFNRPSFDGTNWHSASQLSGFGTPGYCNSQYADGNENRGSIHIDPLAFTPGYDGKEDHTNICYELNKSGYLATIIIFSASGQVCRHLVNNELLGSSGCYSWNGIDDHNQKAASGIYIILAELIHPEGDVLRFKETVIVAM